MHHTECLQSAVYEEKLRKCVTAALDSGQRDLVEICRACAGAFPAAVAAMISHLQDEQLTSPASPLRSPNPAETLPDPHPVDYEWRFSQDTVAVLCKHLEIFGPRIACFGVPSVYSAIDDQQKVVLFDRNPFLFDSLRHVPHRTLVGVDLNVPLSAVTEPFDVILMDPPWYVPHTEAWLHNALQCAQSGSTVVTTLFPPFTRPKAVSEREQLLALFSSLGQVERLPFTAVYETPLFEAETLRGLGLPPLQHWRTAELIQIHLDSFRPPRPLSSPDEPTWRRFRFGYDVVMVRKNDEDTAKELTVSPIYEDGGLLLRSVSARAPRRTRIDFWTSRNRCLTVNGRERLLLLLKALNDGRSPSDVLSTLPRSSNEYCAMMRVLSLLPF